MRPALARAARRLFATQSRYSHLQTLTHSVRQVCEAFAPLDAGARERNARVSLAGRVTAVREASSKLVFLTLNAGGASVQAMCMRNEYAGGDADAFGRDVRSVGRGDVVQLHGFMGKTKVGELSVIPERLTMLAPCVQPFPVADSVKDKDIVYRARHVDLLANGDSMATFLARSRLVSSLRAYLVGRDFVEVETPIMSASPLGAEAEPFVTESRALGEQLFMRVSPELYLKQLVVGGMERVFEVGKLFRNEGIDTTHNPEFTSCEFYMAYATAEDLMGMTEDMLRSIVRATTGETTLLGGRVDLAPAFARIDITSAISELAGGAPFPETTDVDVLRAYLQPLCARLLSPELQAQVADASVAWMIDSLLDEHVTNAIEQPTFVTGHPVAMSPLAKASEARPWVTDRFELFIDGTELCNAYTELNDPEEQLARMRAQTTDAAALDAAELFCQALEYGLPPTAGWGIGIDRLCMFVTNRSSIRDVILFPALRTKR